MIAESILRWKTDSPTFRCCILAHRKELIEQNSEKLQLLAPDLHIGLFSAGLGRKDYNNDILFASIDSVYKRAGEFAPFDALMIDEAHRIPFKGEGKYRRFIGDCKRFNPALVVVGWTATPFRMSGGSLCHKDHILNSVCYDIGITQLIDGGYLCPLRSKVSVAQPDLSGVARCSGGDYINKALSQAVNKDTLVKDTIDECCRILNSEQRHSVVFFCVDIEHCNKVSAELKKHGFYATAVTGKTPAEDRARIIRQFRDGKLRGICNVNVFTEGFDAPCIDAIVLLRPTLSAGLFSQMVGRGLRLHESKSNCLVLDFGGCIDEHGPIDLLGCGYTAMAVCGNCRESFSRALGACPVCGWKIPKRIMEEMEAIERERRMHSSKAANKSILSSEPETHSVNAVYVARHRKPGSPDSVRVQYRCGMSMYSQFLCLDHPGYGGKKSQDWYRTYIDPSARCIAVNDMLSDMFITQKIAEAIKTVTVKRDNKHWNVIGWNNE